MGQDTQRCASPLAALFTLFLAVLAVPSAQAQDMSAYSNRRASDLSDRNQSSTGIPSFQDTTEFLIQKAEKDERERLTREHRFPALRNGPQEQRGENSFGQLPWSQ